MGPLASNPGILLEQALSRLCAIGPLIKFDVTATLLAIFLMLMRMFQANRSAAATRIRAEDIIYIQPDAAYVGTECFEPLLDRNNEHLFLTANELTNRNNFISPKVLAMYDDAAGHQRSLLLDVTSPSVNTQGSIYDKSRVLLGRHPHAVVIVVSGREIFSQCGVGAQPADPAKRPAYVRGGRVTGKAKVFQEVLTTIDIDFPQSPIFVFGYSQMQRGISYRSSNRVPSHMVLLFGKAMSLCRLVQAAGRANGKQARQLMANMGLQEPRVKMLTTAQDFDAIRNYPAFLEEIRRNMVDNNLNLAEALTGTQYAGRYEPTPVRPVGPVRANLGSQQILNFAEVTDDELVQFLPGESSLANLPGLMHMLLKLLSDADAVDEEDAMTLRMITEELDNDGEYWQLVDEQTRGQCQRLDGRALDARLRASLDEMSRSRINVTPLIDRIAEGRAVSYAITERGAYILDLKEGGVPGIQGVPVPRIQGLPVPGVPGIPVLHGVANPTLLARIASLEMDFDDDMDGSDNAVAAPFVDGAQPPAYAFVNSFPGRVLRVMIGCLGAAPPITYSLLFCPLIFLAVNPQHEQYVTGMTHWRACFSEWDVWVARIRAYLPPHPVIEVDGSFGHLMFGVPGSPPIPHYTAAAQERVLEIAEINAEVDACAQMTFRPLAADPNAGPAADDGPEEDDEPEPAAAYRSLGGRSIGGGSAPAYRSLGAVSTAPAAAFNDSVDEQEDTWWATMM